MLDKLLNGLKEKNHKYIAKAISLIENDDPLGKEIIKSIPYKRTNSHRIGITGPPGAGKSTITNQLIKKYNIIIKLYAPYSLTLLVHFLKELF